MIKVWKEKSLEVLQTTKPSSKFYSKQSFLKWLHRVHAFFIFVEQCPSNLFPLTISKHVKVYLNNENGIHTELGTPCSLPVEPQN